MVHKEFFVNNTEIGADFRFIPFFVFLTKKFGNFRHPHHVMWMLEIPKKAWRRKELLNDITWLSLFKKNSKVTWIHIMWCTFGKFVERSLIRKISHIPWIHIMWCGNGHSVNLQFTHLYCVVSNSFIIYILFPWVHITWCETYVSVHHVMNYLKNRQGIICNETTRILRVLFQVALTYIHAFTSRDVNTKSFQRSNS